MPQPPSFRETSLSLSDSDGQPVTTMIIAQQCIFKGFSSFSYYSCSLIPASQIIVMHLSPSLFYALACSSL